MLFKADPRSAFRTDFLQPVIKTIVIILIIIVIIIIIIIIVIIITIIIIANDLR